MRKYREFFTSVFSEEILSKAVHVYKVVKIFTFFYILVAGLWIAITRSIIIGITFMFFKFGTFWLTAIFVAPGRRPTV